MREDDSTVDFEINECSIKGSGMVIHFRVFIFNNKSASRIFYNIFISMIYNRLYPPVDILQGFLYVKKLRKDDKSQVSAKISYK